MKKGLAIWISGCFIMSILVVVGLFGISGQLRDKRNSFLRQFPPHPVVEGDTLNLGTGSFYIAGVTRHHIYLGNYKSPLQLLVVNMALTDTQHVVLKVHGVHNQKFWSARVKVDSPYYYLTDGAIPVVYKGHVQDWRAEKFLTDSVYFRDIIPISSNSFVVKSLSGVTGENILGKLSSWYPYQKFNTTLLEKQVDGVFCTDGILQYDKTLGQLIYLYYYRNQFLVMDTSLTLLYQGHTLDTTSRVKISVGSVESGQSKILSSPPFFVNTRASVSGNWLFVNSNLLARNEHQEAFHDGAVIDVYTLETGTYRFSFYIYHYGGRKKMVEFRVFGDTMIVLYDRLIRVFKLRPKIFRKDL